MAIDRPKAIADAPGFGPERSEGWRPDGFLGSRGMPASDGVPARGVARGRAGRGRKLAGRHCGKAIEGQPAFGQIKPSEAKWRAVDRDRTVQRLASTGRSALAGGHGGAPQGPATCQARCSKGVRPRRAFIDGIERCGAGCLGLNESQMIVATTPRQVWADQHNKFGERHADCLTTRKPGSRCWP
jgi:hypothetical protein